MKSPRRATTKLATLPNTAKPRAPRRCHICPNWPLKASCSCQRKIQTRFPQNAASTVDSIPPDATVSCIQHDDAPVDRPLELRDSQSITETLLPPDVTSSHMSVIQPLEPWSPFPDTPTTPATVVANPPDGHPTTVTENNPQDTNSVIHPHPQGPRSVRTALIPPHTLNDLDPSLLQDHGEQTGHREWVLSPRNTPDTEDTPVAEDTADAEDVQSNNDEVKYGKRLAREARFRKYGMVQGAMRGKTEYSVVRQNKLRDPISDASTATTRFNREIPLIIARAERLAQETDSYVLLLAQQATGSSAAVHFSSSRLRRDAFEDSSRMVNEFQNLMTRLLIAKRSTNLALARELEMSKRALAEAEERITHARVQNYAELNATRAMNLDLLSKLEELRNRMLQNQS